MRAVHLGSGCPADGLGPVASTLACAAPSPAGTAASDPSLPGERLLVLMQSWASWAGSRPWLFAVAAAVVTGFIVGWQAVRGALARWRQRRLSAHAHQVVILPPPLVEASGAAMWWANLAGILRQHSWRPRLLGPVHVALEYRWSGRHLQIVVWVPATVAPEPVAAAVRAAWPGASARIENATPPVPLPGGGAGPASAPAHRGRRRHDPAGDGAAKIAQAQANRASQDTQGVPVILAAGTALVPAMAAWYPLGAPSARDGDPLRALVAAGSDLRAQEAACVQILARVASPRQVRRAQAGAAALKTGRSASGPWDAQRLVGALLAGLVGLLTPGPNRAGSGTRARGAGAPAADPIRDRDVRPGLDTVSGPQWEVAIRIAVTHTLPATRAGARPPVPRRLGAGARAGAGGREISAVAGRLGVLTGALASALAVHDGRNRLRRMRLGRPPAVLAARVLRAGFLLSMPELVSLAGLPTDVAVAGLDRARAKAVPAPIAVPAGGRGVKVLGRAQVGGHSVALPVVDAREHVHLLGSTGAGKSTLMTRLILDDVAAGRGVVLIDPKGDLALDVLDRLPVRAAGRLVLIDPDQPSGSATFNPLQLRRGADADLIVDNIVSIFAAIFQRHWGPRIDDVLRVSCLTLMRHPHPTLKNVPPLLNDKQFRAPFTVGFTDPAGLKGFWEWYESTPPPLRAQVIGPVLARLRAFLLRDFVMATIGPSRSSFDMGRILDTGGILIARLPKGQLGEDTSRLLGSLIFASVWQAATARAQMPEARRRDASVYLDEAHNILNLSGTVSDMLAEARGYHLSMVLAHQHLAQLPRDTQLALSANARNKIFFNCSPEDARQLARHTLPELDEHDVSHLDAYIAATRLVIANRETAAFTLATDPPRAETGHREDLRAAIAAAAKSPANEQESGNRSNATSGHEPGPS